MIGVQATASYSDTVLQNYYENVQSPLFIGIDSTTLTNSTKKTLDLIKPSGIILLLENIKSESQLKSLTKSIHKYGKNRGIKIKVAIDEEGGQVSRLETLPNHPIYPGLVSYKNSAKIDMKREEAHAKYLKSLGIDINFAPVGDVSFSDTSQMYLRTAGSEPVKVGSITSQIIEVQKEAGIESTLKHFPGHGRTEIDSHEATPTINITKKRWLNTDAIPFKKGIDQEVEYIMTGHIIYPQIDNKQASISKKWILSILRDELEYHGKIISDDLKMDSLIGKPYAVRINNALEAGNNFAMLILTENEMGPVFENWIKSRRNALTAALNDSTQ